MTLRIPDRTIVFDYGEVISRTPGPADTSVLLTLAEMDAEAERFWDRYWTHRHDLDRGTLSTDRYWSLIGRELGRDWSPARRHELWAADFRGWISVDPAVVDILAELRDGGTRLALLSNAGFDYGDPFRRSPVGALFDRVFVSAELDLLKPDAAIYHAVLEGLTITAEQMVFIDNKLENVAGAEAVGATGHHFVGAAALRAFLETLAA